MSGTMSQMVTMFNCLRCGHNVFPNGCTILHSHRYYIYVLDFSTFLSRIVAFDFLIIATLVSVKWHFTVVVICISLMTVEHFFMCLLAMCTFSLEKCLLKYFTHLKIFTIFTFVFLS